MPELNNCRLAYELDIAAGSVSAAQLRAAGGAISLTLSQVEGDSGGGTSGRVFLGTYQLQLSNAHGKPLTNLALAHPFTFRYHAPTAQQSWFRQDQRIDAVWEPSSASQSSVKAATTTLASTPATHLLLAQKDIKAAVWSVSTDLSATPTQTTHATTTTPAANVTPAASGSTISFSTEAPTDSWGQTKDVDVGLSSGSLEDSYPLSIPPGPGGLTPSLNL